MDYQEFLSRHRGKITGVILGLIFGWLIILYGFLKTFFIALCAGIGYYIGKRADEKYDFKDLLARVFRKD
ncbi:MAG: DUF2273 domain-containing protein [Armatimonadetes bacterium]|nr:DUF2273 domain-containing protein [Armatimonadota bacterium]